MGMGLRLVLADPAALRPEGEFDLERRWDLVHWFADAGRRHRMLGDWRTQPRAEPSEVDLALYGAEGAPSDEHGRPLLAVGRWNSPAVAARVAAALDQIDGERFQVLLVPLRRAKSPPYGASDEDPLGIARAGFEVLRRAYHEAASRGLGVNVVYY